MISFHDVTVGFSVIWNSCYLISETDTHTQTPSMWPARSQPKPQETGNWRCLISFKMFYFGFGCRFAKVRLFALVVSLHVSIKRHFHSCKGFCLNTTSHFIVPSHCSALAVVCLLIRSICSSKFAYGKLEIVFSKLHKRKLKTQRERRKIRAREADLFKHLIWRPNNDFTKQWFWVQLDHKPKWTRLLLFSKQCLLNILEL